MWVSIDRDQEPRGVARPQRRRQDFSLGAASRRRGGEAPNAPAEGGGVRGGGVPSPSPPGEGSREGAVPLRRKFMIF